MRGTGNGKAISREGAPVGGIEQFHSLYVEHADAIHRYCFRLTGDWSASEDLTAQVFLEAWRKQAQVRVDTDAGLRPWLYGVALNVVRNHIRAERRRARFLGALRSQTALPDIAEDVAARVDEERAMRAILDLVGQLSHAEREVFQLCVWEGLTSAQAAMALNISEGAARTRLARARGRIRELSPASTRLDLMR